MLSMTPLARFRIRHRQKHQQDGQRATAGERLEHDPSGILALLPIEIRDVPLVRLVGIGHREMNVVIRDRAA